MSRYVPSQMVGPQDQSQIAHRFQDAFAISSDRMMELTKDMPRGGFMTVDKYLQNIYNSFAGMHWETTQFMLDDVTSRGRWMNNVFPVMPWAAVKAKYGARIRNELGYTFEMFAEWTLTPYVMGSKTRRAPPRMYNGGNRKAETRSFHYRGGSFVVNRAFVLDDTQLAQALAQFENMDVSIYKTLAYEMIGGWVDESIRFQSEFETGMFPMTDDRIDKRLDAYKNSMFVLHKPNGFLRFENEACQLLLSRDVKADTLLTSSATLRYIKLLDPHTYSYADSGKVAENITLDEMDPEGRGRTPRHNLQVVCSVPFHLGDENIDFDPTLLLCRFGHFYRMIARPEHFGFKGQYSHDFRNISIVNIEEMLEQTLSFRQALRHDGIFNPNDGKVIDDLSKYALMVLAGIMKPMTTQEYMAWRSNSSRAQNSNVADNQWTRREHWTSFAIQNEGDLSGTGTSNDGLPPGCNAYAWFKSHNGWLDRVIPQIQALSKDKIEKWDLIISTGSSESSNGRSGGGGFSATGSSESSSGRGGEFSEGFEDTKTESESSASPANISQALAECSDKTFVEIITMTRASPREIANAVTDREETREDIMAWVEKIAACTLVRIQANAQTHLINADGRSRVQAFLQSLQSNRDKNETSQIIARLRTSKLPNLEGKDDINKQINRIIGEAEFQQFYATEFTDIGEPDVASSSTGCASHAEICGKLKNTRMTYHAFREWLLDCNIYMPISLLLLQPDICVTCCSNLVSKTGPDTGVVAIREAGVSWIPEDGSDQITVNASMRARLCIVTRRNLLFIPHTSVRYYNCGGGTKFVDCLEHRNRIDRSGALPKGHGIYVVPGRADEELQTDKLETPGDWHPAMSGRETAFLQYQMAAYASQRYRFYHKEHMFDSKHFMPDPQNGDSSYSIKGPNNTLCFRGSWHEWEETTTGFGGYKKLIEGTSPMGAVITTKAARVLHGQEDFFGGLGGGSIQSAIKDQEM